MKNILIIVSIIGTFLLSSCVVHHPPGHRHHPHHRPPAHGLYKQKKPKPHKIHHKKMKKHHKGNRHRHGSNISISDSTTFYTA